MATNRGLMCAALCATMAVSASSAAKSKPKPAVHTVPKIHLEEAYFNGEVMKLAPGTYSAGEHALVVGPWSVGPRVSPKPNDKRPNLYFVMPGGQHRFERDSRYDNTMILSAAPDDPKEFDVYWAVVLDPALKDDFTGEQQLLAAHQATFTPGDDFTFDQIPSASFLKAQTKIARVDDLKKFRLADGSLPRVAIITAGFAVRLTIQKPEEKQADKTPSPQ